MEDACNPSQSLPYAVLKQNTKVKAVRLTTMRARLRLSPTTLVLLSRNNNQIQVMSEISTAVKTIVPTSSAARVRRLTAKKLANMSATKCTYDVGDCGRSEKHDMAD